MKWGIDGDFEMSPLCWIYKIGFRESDDNLLTNTISSGSKM